MNASSSIKRPKLLVFASGTKDGGQHRQGGSGFENLVVASRTGVLQADIIAVVSNHEHGSVRERAKRLGIPFVYFNPSQHSNILENVGMSDTEMAEAYQKIVTEAMGRGGLPRSEPRSTTGEWIALSGWYKQVKGLDPRRTFNIHPALLSQLGGPFDGLRASRFGGKGMYRNRVHEAVKAALDAGEITESGFTMHFVTDEYDRGPAFFEYRVPLRTGMSADEIEKAVNKAEHEWQPKITNMVVHREIQWDGKDPKSLAVPQGYKYLPKS